MGLCLNFLPVLEGEADIVETVDGGVIHQRVPVFQLELGECFRQGLEALNEGFNVGSLGLHPIQLRHHRLKALFGGFKALDQVVVAFLGFRLVKGDVGVFVNGLLHHVGNKLRFFQQRGLFRFQLGGIKEQVHHLTAVGDMTVRKNGGHRMTILPVSKLMRATMPFLKNLFSGLILT